MDRGEVRVVIAAVAEGWRDVVYGTCSRLLAYVAGATGASQNLSAKARWQRNTAVSRHAAIGVHRGWPRKGKLSPALLRETPEDASFADTEVLGDLRRAMTLASESTYVGADVLDSPLAPAARLVQAEQDICERAVRTALPFFRQEAATTARAPHRYGAF